MHENKQISNALKRVIGLPHKFFIEPHFFELNQNAKMKNEKGNFHSPISPISQISSDCGEWKLSCYPTQKTYLTDITVVNFDGRFRAQQPVFRKPELGDGFLSKHQSTEICGLCKSSCIPWGRLCTTRARRRRSAHIIKRNRELLLPLAIFLPLWTILHPTMLHNLMFDPNHPSPMPSTAPKCNLNSG